MGKRGASSAPPAGGSDDRLIELTRRLAAVAAELGLSEIEVESAGTRLRVQRAGAAPAPATHMVAAPATSPAGPTIEQGMVAYRERTSTPSRIVCSWIIIACLRA